LPICSAVAVPPPGPKTTALMVPGVNVVPLMNSPATSMRGTVAKAPTNRPPATTLEVVSSLVVAWARMAPVLRRPPVAAAGLHALPETTPRQVKLTADEPWMATARVLTSESMGWAVIEP